MWVKTTEEKFEQFGIRIETEKQLSDGEYIIHFEITGPTKETAEQFITIIRMNTSFELLTDGQMAALLTNDPSTAQ